MGQKGSQVGQYREAGQGSKAGQRGNKVVGKSRAGEAGLSGEPMRQQGWETAQGYLL